MEDSKATDLQIAQSYAFTHKWNWGAFFLTPFWLVRNGFLVTLAVYLVLAFTYPWTTIPISVLFLIKGNDWSWDEGRRWKSIEEFADSQYIWNIVGLAIGVLLGLSLLTLAGMLVFGHGSGYA